MFRLAVPQQTSEMTLEGHQDAFRFAGAGLWEVPRPIWQVVTGALCGYGGYLMYLACTEGDIGSFFSTFFVFFILGPGVISWLLTFLGRAPAELCIVRGELRVRELRVFYVRRRSWPVEEIDSIEMGASSVGSGEDCPLPELQIGLVGGKKYGILRGRHPQVLEHTAQWLRDSLDIPCLATEVN